MKYFLLISAIFFITCKSTPEVGVKYKPENSYLRLDINENKAFVIGVSIPSSKKNLAVCFDQTNIFRHKTESGIIIIEKNKDSYAFIFESKDLYVKGEMKILPILFSDCFEKININTYTTDELEVFSFYKLYKIKTWRYVENGIEQVINYKDELNIYNAQYDDFCKIIN